MPLNANYTGTENEVAKNTDVLKAFLAMSPIDLENHIDGFVVDLDTAKTTLKQVAVLLKIASDEIIALK